MNWQAAGNNPLSHVIPHPWTQVEFDLGILTPEHVVTVLSDQIVMMITAGILLSVFFPILLRKRQDKNDEIGRLVPRGFASFVELVCDYFRKQVAEPLLGEHADRFVKYIWTVFFFVLTMNLLGLLPLATVFAPLGVHVGGTATGNIWVTATMACLTLLLMIVNGLRYGGMDYIAHFSPGPWWMAPLMIPVEIMGLFAKIFALAVRLFANMVAGHVLMAVLLALLLSAGQALGAIFGGAIALTIVVGSVAITMLEIFVAFLQAFIFTYLTAVFIGMSVNVHHDDEHGEEAHAH